jgi:hypothetical protein
MGYKLMVYGGNLEAISAKTIDIKGQNLNSYKITL